MELKAKGVDDVYLEYFNTGKHDLAQVYLKTEADKVISDLEESHKMEVEQLLIKIVEMKKACKGKDDWCLHTLKRERHHKYKRCLAMAYVEWLKQMILRSYFESILYRRAVTREHKWKEMAQKFKEAK